MSNKMRQTAVITGASSGLGSCLAKLLSKTHTVVDWSLEKKINVAVWDDVEAVAKKCGHVDILVNCAGYNHLNWIPDFDPTEFDRVMNANCKAIFLTSKVLAGKMHRGTILNIISTASHIPMTCSVAYNASKGAAAIMTRQMAKELWNTHKITVFGISPGKMKNTAMSNVLDFRVAKLRGMSSIKAAKDYQLSKILTGEEINPEYVAEFAYWLLSKKYRHRHLAGCILEYGA